MDCFLVCNRCNDQSVNFTVGCFKRSEKGFCCYYSKCASLEKIWGETWDLFFFQNNLCWHHLLTRYWQLNPQWPQQTTLLIQSLDLQGQGQGQPEFQAAKCSKTPMRSLLKNLERILGKGLPSEFGSTMAYFQLVGFHSTKLICFAMVSILLVCLPEVLLFLKRPAKWKYM